MANPFLQILSRFTTVTIAAGDERAQLAEFAGIYKMLDNAYQQYSDTVIPKEVEHVDVDDDAMDDDTMNFDDHSEDTIKNANEEDESGVDSNETKKTEVKHDEETNPVFEAMQLITFVVKEGALERRKVYFEPRDALKQLEPQQLLENFKEFKAVVNALRNDQKAAERSSKENHFLETLGLIKRVARVKKKEADLTLRAPLLDEDELEEEHKVIAKSIKIDDDESSSKSHDNLAADILDSMNHANPKKYGETVLHKAVKANKARAVANILTLPGININAQTSNGTTALHFALSNHEPSVEIVTSLIKNNADVNVPMRTGVTAFHQVLRSHSDSTLGENLMNHFIEYGGVTARVNTTDNALHFAAGNKDLTQDQFGKLLAIGLKLNTKKAKSKKVSDQFINALNKLGETPLIVAMNSENYDKALALLYHGADPNIFKNMSPLHIACEKGLVDLVYKLVTDYKAELQALSSDNISPLGYAVINNHKNLVEEFIRHSYPLNDQDGEAAVQLAMRKNHTDILHLLIENGANPNTKLGHTPLIAYAANKGDHALIDLLKAKGVKFTTDEAKIAVRNALHNADTEMLYKLIDYGANPATHLVFHNGSKGASSSIFSSSISSISKYSGPQETKLLQNGDNVLHFAVKTGDLKLATLCLSNLPTIINATNRHNKTPANLAVKTLNPAMARLLHEHGARDEVTKTSTSTLFRRGVNRGFEHPEQLIEFFENSSYELTEEQQQIRDEEAPKFAKPGAGM